MRKNPTAHNGFLSNVKLFNKKEKVGLIKKAHATNERLPLAIPQPFVTDGQMFDLSPIMRDSPRVSKRMRKKRVKMLN